MRENRIIALIWIIQGPCQGDSGGPLMYEEDTSNGVKRTLIGTVSAGLSCGKNTPSWYTRVGFKIT